MALFVFLSQLSPLLLLFVGSVLPSFADDLGYLGVCETWMLLSDLSVMVDPVEDERYRALAITFMTLGCVAAARIAISARLVEMASCDSPFLGRGILGSAVHKHR